VGLDGYHEGPAEPIEAVDEECGELALFDVLEEPPALRSLVQGDGALHAVVGVYLRHFQTVEAAVFLQKLALDLDGLAFAMLLGTHAE
jgi:hypothetical protein